MPILRMDCCFALSKKEYITFLILDLYSREYSLLGNRKGIFSTGFRKTDLRFLKRLSGFGSARLLRSAKTASSF